MTPQRSLHAAFILALFLVILAGIAFLALFSPPKFLEKRLLTEGLGSQASLTGSALADNTEHSSTLHQTDDRRKEGEDEERKDVKKEKGLLRRREGSEHSTNSFPSALSNDSDTTALRRNSSTTLSRPSLVSIFPKSWWSSGTNPRQPPSSLTRAPNRGEPQGVVLRWSARASEKMAEWWEQVQRVNLTGHDDWLEADFSIALAPTPSRRRTRATTPSPSTLASSPTPTETIPLIHQLIINSTIAITPARLYEKEHSTCRLETSDRFVEMPCTDWGITSEIRELSTVFLFNTLRNITVLPRPDLHSTERSCKEYCNLADTQGLDNHLGCFFRPVSNCLSPLPIPTPVTASEPKVRRKRSRTRQIQSRVNRGNVKLQKAIGNYGISLPPFWGTLEREGDVWWESINRNNERSDGKGVSAAHLDSDKGNFAAAKKYGSPLVVKGWELKDDRYYYVPNQFMLPDLPPSRSASMSEPTATPHPNFPQPPPELKFATQLSMLRSITSTMIFRPSTSLVAAARDLETALGLRRIQGPSTSAPDQEHMNPSRSGLHPMLILHARRTDKVKDSGKATEVRRGFADRQVPVEYYGRMAAEMEQQVGVQFRSIFLLSDDLDLWTQRTQLARHMKGGEDVRVMVNPTWLHFAPLINTTEWRKGGHNLLRATTDKTLIFKYHEALLADVLVAGRNGDYLLGCGSSGVSQFIAHLMGSRLRLDPEWVTLWEEDMFAVWAGEEKSRKVNNKKNRKRTV